MGLLYLHFIIMVGHFTVFCLGLVASVGHWYKCQAKLSFHAFYIYLIISGYLVELKSALWLQGKIWVRTVPSGQLYLGVVGKTNFFYLFMLCCWLRGEPAYHYINNTWSISFYLLCI